MRRSDSTAKQPKSPPPKPAPATAPEPRAPPALVSRFAARMTAWSYYFPRHAARLPAGDEELDGLTRALGVRLPAAYEAFLRRFGRTAAAETRLTAPVSDGDWRKGPVAIDVFYGFGSDGAYDVHKAFRTYADRIPKTMLPIACTPGDDQICLGVDGEERGLVYLWSHAAPRKTAARDDDGPWWHCIYRMAPSFEAFFDSISGERDGADPAAVETPSGDGADGERAALLRSEAIENEMADRERRGAAVRDALVQLTDDEAEIGLVLGALHRGERRKLRRILENIARAEGRTIDAARVERAVCAAFDGAESQSRATPAAVPAAPAPRGPARVRHKVFGEGSVVRELENNKVEVKFDGPGNKVLIRTVLEFI